MKQTTGLTLPKLHRIPEHEVGKTLALFLSIDSETWTTVLRGKLMCRDPT